MTFSLSLGLMMVLVTSWYATMGSDRTYHMRVTKYDEILLPFLLWDC